MRRHRAWKIITEFIIIKSYTRVSIFGLYIIRQLLPKSFSPMGCWAIGQTNTCEPTDSIKMFKFIQNSYDITPST